MKINPVSCFSANSNYVQRNKGLSSQKADPVVTTAPSFRGGLRTLIGVVTLPLTAPVAAYAALFSSNNKSYGENLAETLKEVITGESESSGQGNDDLGNDYHELY
ncbi:MAG: hypothetical protein MJ237_04885 [bacterium]|nr:hypothetical protein [bacterium]